MEARILYLFICFVTYIVPLFYANMENTTLKYDVKPDFNAAFPFQKVWIHQKGFLHGTGYFKIFLQVLQNAEVLLDIVCLRFILQCKCSFKNGKKKYLFHNHSVPFCNSTL